MVLQVTIVVGNPRAGSRTRTVAETLVQKLLEPGGYELEVVELADHSGSVFDWASAEVRALNDRVAASDLAVFATPTYKASYTGLLKAFLDRYPANGLAGVTAIPVHTGGDLTHSLAPTVTLAPLLVELGAIVPGRGLYFVAGQIDRVDEIVGHAAAEYAANLGRLSVVEAAVRR
ncbi:NADPH-dependent FMN reductase [Herbiconiux liangxiaofengii]|uniref:NADPH-dependent FMN reductase n=1 Tax=Herbiconiux liangxiaofengii TaxID=3342795 RepID=UPI0035BA584C